MLTELRGRLKSLVTLVAQEHCIVLQKDTLLQTVMNKYKTFILLVWDEQAKTLSTSGDCNVVSI